MAKNHKPTSRYIDTPNKDFYLDIWNAPNITASSNDREIEIESKYHERPDLLSYDLYGTVNLWWVFAMRNKDILFDPIYDFKSGTKIFVVSKNRLEDIV